MITKKSIMLDIILIVLFLPIYVLYKLAMDS